MAAPLAWLHWRPGEGTGFRDRHAYVLFSLNLLLGTFNLLPLAPLDGSTGIMLFMSESTAQRYLDWLRESSYARLGPSGGTAGFPLSLWSD